MLDIKVIGMGLLLFPLINITAQDNSSLKRMENILEKETASLKSKFTTDTKHALQFKQVVLPENVFTAPSPEHFLYPGISDVLGDTLAARTQAIQRANMLRGLIKGVDVKHVSEYFIKTNNFLPGVTTQYVEYYEIETRFKINYATNQKNMRFVYLDSGEVLAWIPADSSLTDSTGSSEVGIFRGKLYSKENSSFTERNFFRASYSFFLSSDTLKESIDFMDFIWHTNGRCLLNSKNNDLPDPDKCPMFVYICHEKVDSAENQLGVSVKEGLWPALISSLLLQISSDAKYGQVRIKNLAENYRNEVIELKRVIHSFTARPEPQCIYMKNQTIILKPCKSFAK